MIQYEFRLVIKDRDTSLISEELTEELNSVLEFFGYNVVDITLEDEYNVEDHQH